MTPCFDVWVCQGRVCTAAGAAGLVSAVDAALTALALDDAAPARTRLLRGGCYGLCELGPNVVVRRHEGALPDVETDRLSLTGASNERVYCGLDALDIEHVVRAHVKHDRDVPELSRAAREREQPAKSRVAERLRQLREERGKER